MFVEKDGLHAAARRAMTRCCERDAPPATLALRPLMQSRDEMNARFGGGQIMGACLGENRRQAVAVKPWVAPDSSVHGDMNDGRSLPPPPTLA